MLVAFLLQFGSRTGVWFGAYKGASVVLKETAEYFGLTLCRSLAQIDFIYSEQDVCKPMVDLKQGYVASGCLSAETVLHVPGFAQLLHSDFRERYVRTGL